MFFILFVIVLLVSLNAFFVVVEFAAVSVPHSRIQALANDGNRSAHILWDLLQDHQRFDAFIAACQVGITISSLVLGAYGQVQLGAYIRPWLTPWPEAEYLLAPSILILLTAFQMILGELLPKSLALQFPVRLAMLTLFPMLMALWLLKLPIVFLNGSGNLLLKLFGFKAEAHRHIHSPEEIGLLITEGERAGFLDPQEKDRMQKALEISDWTVRRLMVPYPYLHTLNLQQSVRSNLKRIARSPFSTLVVYDGRPENIKGYIRCKEVLRYGLIHQDIKQLDTFIHPLLIIPRSLSIQRAMEKFRSHHTRLALVVNEFGGVSGLVTLKDILAELTGSIGDEFMQERGFYRHLSDGRWRVSGLMRLDKLASEFGLNWEEEVSSTVGGYLMSRLARFPYRGQVVEINGLQIEIESVSAKTIRSVIFPSQVKKI